MELAVIHKDLKDMMRLLEKVDQRLDKIEEKLESQEAVEVEEQLKIAN